MKELVEHILDSIIENRVLSEDLLYEFSEKTLKLIQSRQIGSIPDVFWELENYVETFWRNGMFTDTEDPCIVYQMGQLLSFTNMLSMMVDEAEKEASLEDYAQQWYDRYCVFQCIHENKGITHKALAEKTDISVSALSQFTNKVKWTGVFNCRVMGREKHYYLTEYGERLYMCMRKKTEEDKMRKDKLPDITITPSYFGLEKDFLQYNTLIRRDNENMKERIHKVENREEDIFNSESAFPKSKFNKVYDTDNEERYICIG